MKVLFLDIDGVVNRVGTRQSFHGFMGIDPFLASRVSKIILDTDAAVVLTSTWRIFKDGREEVDRHVYKTFDVTPTADTGFRGEEVKMWLDQHPEVTRYAIIDDDSDFYADQPLFKTAWQTGITDEIAQQVTEYLNREERANE
ncbi:MULTISPECIES: HAD domain-containing protein [unclassified Arthrobacter]|uniref:HAD domain-containing protein n=1 Tax=unclassified Arthrobacter TaxID=235627 RepID=UPI001D274EB6|nr:HAD domain-containing protein [Arthrobacter sp. Bi26]CAH0155753.1 hypothetical protein SRABI26_00825 [Arthrobacter sp. Bi26]